MQKYLDNAQKGMQKVIDYLKQELSKVRNGRAQVSILDNVMVDAYDQQTPINQLALITTPDAHQILIKPYDPSLLDNMESAIIKANLGLNPSSDGEVIRLNVPGLTQETRQEIAKEVKAIGENAKIKIRNVRRDILDDVKKDEDLNQDMLKGAQNQIQSITDEFNKNIDELVKQKEQEVLTI